MSGPADDADCRACRHFCDDPEAIEAQLPGMTILGSAYGSVRGDAGLCDVLGRFMDPLPAAECADFSPRPGASDRSEPQIADQYPPKT